MQAGSWYYEDVLKLDSHHIILGYGNGRFGPDDLITREQMATILMRVADRNA